MLGTTSSLNADQSLSLLGLEAALTFIAIPAAFIGTRRGNYWFKGIERRFGQLARRRLFAVVAVGIATIVLRLAILPLIPIPTPFIPDDFSNLLAADTFAHGRLTNPTPAMWTHFESVHITMKPTYMSMYFPAQGLVMAAGKVLFGNPWFGILISAGLMCAAICWMLQAWLPPGWALLGGILAMVRLGLFSYWTNMYTGAGSIAALGGALVLGALPRLMKTVQLRYGLLMAVGIVLLALTRPYEGLLLCLPIVLVLGRWAIFGKNRPSLPVLIRRAALPLLLIVAGGAWLGYYDFRAFGRPTTLPYSINRATYAMVPYFIWQPPRPEPHYRHEQIRKFYYENELDVYKTEVSGANFLVAALGKVLMVLMSFGGIALLPSIVMFRRVLLDRRIRFLVICAFISMAGMLIMIYMLPHYLAPFTAAFYAIGLQAMRHLRVWRSRNNFAGAMLVRFSVAVCLVLAGARVFAQPLGLRISRWPAQSLFGIWCGPDLNGNERAGIESRLEQLPGRQLVLVRYSPKRDSRDIWVYNDADIDASKVIWAWDMGASENRELIDYYRDRKVWLVQMETHPAAVSPYSLTEQASSTTTR